LYQQTTLPVIFFSPATHGPSQKPKAGPVHARRRIRAIASILSISNPHFFTTSSEVYFSRAR
jgi:hypothetical protein